MDLQGVELISKDGGAQSFCEEVCNVLFGGYFLWHDALAQDLLFQVMIFDVNVVGILCGVPL